MKIQKFENLKIQRFKNSGIFKILNSGIFKFLNFGLLIILLCNTGNAQIYKFQMYGSKEGLRYKVVYSIVQDKYGYMWFTTGFGLFRYDGFKFSPPDDDLPATNVSTAFSDKNGNLWFGYDDGLVVKYDGIEFSVADTSISKKTVTQIIQAPKGEILVATQTGGITRIGKKIDRLTDGFEEIMISAMCFNGDDQLLVGTQNDGLYLFQYADDGQNMTFIAKDSGLSYMNVTSIYPKDDGRGYWITAEDDGVYYVTVHENSISSLNLNIPDLEDAKIQSVQEDTQGNLWISTLGKGLVRVQLSTDMRILKINIYNNSNGLDDNVKQSFFDNQRNLWVATFGNGVACVTNTAFTFFEAETLNPIGSNATAVYSADDSEYWIAGAGTIIRITKKPVPKKTVWRRADGLPNCDITVLRPDDKGNMWIGTERSGLYKLSKETQRILSFYKEENSLTNAIQNFVFVDGQIWMATREGVVVIDQQTGKKINHYTTYEGDLPHNRILDIFKDSKNGIWIATTSNSLINLKDRRRLTVPDKLETEFSAIAEDEHGRIWAGTLGKGVFLFDDTQDTLSIYQFTTTEDDLISDHCYALASDGNGRMWIGHRVGLTSINTEKFTINTNSEDNGIYGDVNPLAMSLNQNGEMLIGMTDGVMIYDSKNSPQELIPMLNLSQVLINDIPYNTHKHVVLRYGNHRVEFKYVGLHYSNPSLVTYQYWLQDVDREWSSLSTSNTTLYHRIENGDYSFWVKACNSNNCTEKTMLFTFKVRNPFWKTWWFFLIMMSLIIGLGYIIINIRERNIRKQQEFLEKELKTRTKQVRKQKEEIEVKNRDITDSINYAQRIQFSVLPSNSTLLEHCTDAFIFYRPRDIVSGDFYWFDFFPKHNRLLIVCADSTGHGVPGAFMSLIGTTLIKDIAMRPDVFTPADILYRLDENIQSVLNQNRESEHANDGMDIIVCEINTKTYRTNISSAMRPVIVYQNGVPTTYKSNRASIGGQPLENKIFETTELQLSKGDTIYMFTDGYTDQFGGPTGKKLKMNRLQTILDDIYNRNMSEQHRVIKENFDLWKGNISQVDDVLMIGVRL